VRALRAQVRAELLLTARRGDSVLLNICIPLGLLVFFSLVDVLPKPRGISHPVDFLAPGLLALAVMSTAMVSLGIATGFERQYGVLKRLGVTPLGRPRLLTAKMASVSAIEVVQTALIVAAAFALGWSPGGSVGLAIPAMIAGTAAFAGIGLLMAGTLTAEMNLAAANGLYLLLLLLGGIIFPLGRLPAGLRVIAEALPSAALSQVLHSALTAGASATPGAWIILLGWAIATPLAAARTFRWE
jgi:ABC-2 type transport system permease protein